MKKRHLRSMSTAVTAALLAPVFLIALAGCNTLEVACPWPDTALELDGKIDDWEGMPVTFFDEADAALALASDSLYLYVQFRTTDADWVRAIKMSGLTLYLDSQGKKSKDFYIRFQGGPEVAMGPGGQRQGPDRGDRETGRTTQERPDRPSRESATRLTCYIKDVILEKEVPVDGGQGPAVAFDTSYGFYTYEFAVPLTERQVRYYGLGASPGQKIGLGAEWGDVGSMGNRPSGGMGGGPPGGSGGGPPGGGMGGGPPGGMGGGGMGGPGGGPPGGMDKPEKQEIWMKAVLALPPGHDSRMSDEG